MPQNPLSLSGIPNAKRGASHSLIYQTAFGMSSSIKQHAIRLGVNDQTLINWLTEKHAIPESKRAAVLDIIRTQACALDALYFKLFNSAKKSHTLVSPIRHLKPKTESLFSPL